MNTRILSDDFIDEAQVRFARATTKELARYIEAAVIDAMVARRAKEQREPADALMFSLDALGVLTSSDKYAIADRLERVAIAPLEPLAIAVDLMLPKGTVVVRQAGKEVCRLVGVGQ